MSTIIQFESDHYFCIGHDHLTAGRPCQDYAFSGVSGQVAVAVVSDGCSTGGETDVGARIVARSTTSVILKSRLVIEQPDWHIVPADFHTRQQVHFSTARETLGLRTNDLVATCLTVILTPYTGAVCVQGDGVAAVVYADGTMEVHRFDWKGKGVDGVEVGAPLYPSYGQEGIAQFLQEFHSGNVLAERPIHQVWHVSASGEFHECEPIIHVFRDVMDGVVIPIDREQLVCGDIRCVAVFSDGVTQVDGVDWKEAVSCLLAFKQMAGQFVTRRMMRQVKNWQKPGKGPLDDISCAAVHVNSIADLEGVSHG